MSQINLNNSCLIDWIFSSVDAQICRLHNVCLWATRRLYFSTRVENWHFYWILFKPLVVETFGGWDAEAVTYLKQLGRHSARRWGKKDSLEIKYFFQRLSVALQRGNATLLTDRDRECV